MNRLFIFLILLLAFLIIDMPFDYTIKDGDNVTQVVLADGGCSDYYKDDTGFHKKNGAKGVPEPTVMMLVAAGIASVGLYRKFGNKK